jgi:hypothetical protein
MHLKFLFIFIRLEIFWQYSVRTKEHKNVNQQNSFILKWFFTPGPNLTLKFITIGHVLWQNSNEFINR